MDTCAQACTVGTGHTVWELILGWDWVSLCQQLIAYRSSLSTRTRLCGVSPVHFSMPAGVVIMLVLFKFMDAVSLSRIEDSVSQPMSWSSGPHNLSILSLFNDLLLTLECRGCVADLALFGHSCSPILWNWPVVDFCNSFCLLQRETTLMKG